MLHSQTNNPFTKKNLSGNYGRLTYKCNVVKDIFCLYVPIHLHVHGALYNMKIMLHVCSLPYNNVPLKADLRPIMELFLF